MCSSGLMIFFRLLGGYQNVSNVSGSLIEAYTRALMGPYILWAEEATVSIVPS
jgi:hypothetical protein